MTARTWKDRAAPRVAEPGEGISLDELALAARNHAMPAEALRWDVTPVGLHYVLVHYDIPAVDPVTWRLRGRWRRRATVDARRWPTSARCRSGTRAVTLECAGNGRALLEPRPVSQPWLIGAVGTAEWTGMPLAPMSSRRGRPPCGRRRRRCSPAPTTASSAASSRTTSAALPMRRGARREIVLVATR